MAIISLYNVDPDPEHRCCLCQASKVKVPPNATMQKKSNEAKRSRGFPRLLELQFSRQKIKNSHKKSIQFIPDLGFAQLSILLPIQHPARFNYIGACVWKIQIQIQMQMQIQMQIQMLKEVQYNTN